MSEVFVHCVREDKSIQQIFSIKGPTLDEFMYHLVSNDVCPLKNYICKYVDYIKQLNIYYFIKQIKRKVFQKVVNHQIFCLIWLKKLKFNKILKNL